MKIIGIKTRKAWHLKQIPTGTVHAFIFTDMGMLGTKIHPENNITNLFDK